MEQLRCGAVVIGAGAVGLAAARALVLAGHQTLVLEKNARFGQETSARNSEVIHAGIYPDYPPGSLKARLCIEGRRRLYEFAQGHGVPHRRIGKWVVAAEPEQLPHLAAIREAAQEHGVDDCALLPAEQVRTEEPQLRFVEVMQSPSTGLIDSHAYMLALLADMESAGGQLVRKARTGRIARRGGSWRLEIDNDGQTVALEAQRVVNAAGLWAQTVATAIEGLSVAPPLYLAKGSYATYRGPSPFRRLIYPVPDAGGLGVHLTLDLAGGARLGPDVEWLENADPAAIDYAVRANIAADFARRARSWWPSLEEERLSPAYAGVRPKLTRGATPCDFRIDGPAFHGLAGLVNLFGIESPGLTASLAIADHVVELLDG